MGDNNMSEENCECTNCGCCSTENEQCCDTEEISLIDGDSLQVYEVMDRVYTMATLLELQLGAHPIVENNEQMLTEYILALQALERLYTIAATVFHDNNDHHS